MFTKLLAANVSVNFAKCTETASHQKPLSMVVDSTGVRLSPSKVETMTKFPAPRM